MNKLNFKSMNLSDAIAEAFILAGVLMTKEKFKEVRDRAQRNLDDGAKKLYFARFETPKKNVHIVVLDKDIEQMDLKVETDSIQILNFFELN